MSFSGSLPQINHGVQGVTQGGHHKSCISADDIGRLHIIDGILNVIKYINTILEPKFHTGFQQGYFTYNALLIFQQDSAPCHIVKDQMICNGQDSRYNLVALHFIYDQERRRFVERAQNKIAVAPDFHKRVLFSDEAHFWLNGYVNKQNCRIWSEANPQVYVETPLHPEKLTVWCALWSGGILLQNG
ncbi:putative DD41D transposase [Trichonephila clavipes]|nr:putative DD41D transposase [Trichonephila clavipes]